MVRPTAEQIENALDAFFDYLWPVSWMVAGMAGLLAAALGWEPTLHVAAAAAFAAVSQCGALSLRNLIQDRKKKKEQ